MYRAWSGAAKDGEALARLVEAHLNEHASEVISVSYAVAGEHYALAVYRSIGVEEQAAAVEFAEQLIQS